jgi:hypothetical protein
MVERRLLASLAAAVLGLLILAAPAWATESISSFETSLSTSEAGAHPTIRTSFTLADPAGPQVPREVELQMPEGIFGNPGAVTKCSPAKFALSECPTGSQVGVIMVKAYYEGEPEHVMGASPLYNLFPKASSETALLAFVVPGVDIPIEIPVTVRTGSDYGLNFNVSGISQQVPLAGFVAEIWGTPADISHNPERFPTGSPGDPPGCVGSITASCVEGPPFPESGVASEPYVDNPSSCTGAPLPVKLFVRTYQDPEHVSTSETSLPPTSDCAAQRFDPSLDTVLTDTHADSASGLDISVGADQVLSAAPAPSSIRSASVILPDGFSINPDAADGQLSCSDAQAGFGSEAPSHCPDNSKVGTVEVLTPALEGPLNGSLYLGQPQPGNQYRVFMIFEGFGIHAKLHAGFQPNPTTGQLTMTVPSLPQVPFKEFDLHLFASDRGLIATATHCSIYRTVGTVTPWNQTLAPQSAQAWLNVSTGPHGAPCPGLQRPFRPRLAAGSANPGAGAFSAFHLKLDRDDGDQYLRDLDFQLPPGFTGSLRGITYCPEAAILAAAANAGRAEQASPSCPASSFIGTTNVAAGPGDHPFHAVGRMYLSGPFKGAPLSLAAITPALAGPYDYGVVVVRVALHVDPHDAHVFAASDTMPQIIGGVPIRMRSIQVNIDRPNFTINPTNCDPFAVVSHGIGAEGTSVAFSSPFQVINCSTLPFKPKMAIRQLGGRKQTGRSHDPRLRFDLWTRHEDANVASVGVTLPKAFAVDQRHLGNICSRAELVAKHCAGRQAIGRAEVQTPLLDQPLKGPAYAVSGYGKLPHLAFILAGQVTIIPEAESSSVRGGHLKTVVPLVPDAPIGHFRLTLLGGKHGYIINTRSLCGAPPKTLVEYFGQNGKKRRQKVRVKTACRKHHRAKHHRHGRAR